MHIKDNIEQLNPVIADVVTDATPGFRFATGEGELVFTEVGELRSGSSSATGCCSSTRPPLSSLAIVNRSSIGGRERTTRADNDGEYSETSATAGEEDIRRDESGTFELKREIDVTPTGLVVRSSMTNLSDAAAALTDVEPVCLEFAVGRQDWVHYHAKGGGTDWDLPPNAYSTRVTYDLRHTLYLQSHGAGRSSNDDLPLLISVSEPLEAGLFFGMEWSGEWILKMTAVGDDKVRLGCAFKSPCPIAPGETVDLPPVHLGFFNGGFDEGTNALRRHIYEQVCPHYQGKPTLPRVSYDHWFGIENRNTIDFMKTQVDRAAEMGAEVFVHDAAWFEGGFPHGVGNWDRVDREKFPNGLEELADYVRSKGMDFGLWFEIERAAPETSAVRNHPELFVEAPQWGQQPFGGCTGRQFHLNLALPEAQDWAIATVGELIERLDIRWSRWDYNIEPNPFWRSVDPTGAIQFAYMKGLYRVLDTLMARYPNWMVETCASGGRRFDLGTIRRAHTCWFSDHTTYPEVCRHMQARANRFLPGHLLNSSVAVGPGHGVSEVDDTAILSRMLGKLAFDGDIASLTPEMAARARHWSDVFKSIRHLLVQDFHQLTAAPTTGDDWDVMSFNAYDGSEAALYAFSGRKAGEMTIPLRGLNPDAEYSIECLNDGAVETKRGTELMQKGLTISLARNSAKLWHVKDGAIAG
jgi:alpha-galactosidase